MTTTPAILLTVIVRRAALTATLAAMIMVLAMTAKTSEKLRVGDYRTSGRLNNLGGLSSRKGSKARTVALGNLALGARKGNLADLAVRTRKGNLANLAIIAGKPLARKGSTALIATRRIHLNTFFKERKKNY